VTVFVTRLSVDVATTDGHVYRHYLADNVLEC
jgi:hypothetical protein